MAFNTTYNKYKDKIVSMVKTIMLEYPTPKVENSQLRLTNCFAFCILYFAL